MKTIPTPLLNHLSGSSTTLALCWRIVKRDSTIIYGTGHDQDIKIDSGPLAATYKASSNILPSNVKSNSDLAVDNLEVIGALADNSIRIDITRADIEARNLDFAAVKTFFVNWQAPNDGQIPLRTGFLGQLNYDSNNQYTTEVRGLSQLLQTNIMQTYSDKCTVKHFGDARCTVDVAAISITATVTSIVSRRAFTVSGITSQPSGYFSLGNLTGLTGNNVGYLRQIRLDNNGGTGVLALFSPFPLDVEIGDTFTMAPGCDRLASTCKNKFDNRPNFRGYGELIPGIDAMLSGPAGLQSGQPNLGAIVENVV